MGQHSSRRPLRPARGNRSRTRPGGSQQGLYYDLVRAERPLSEIVREPPASTPRTRMYRTPADRQRFVRFVNNDHCLLSSRASLALPDYLPGELRYLPMAQTIWYVPPALTRGTSFWQGAGALRAPYLQAGTRRRGAQAHRALGRPGAGAP